MRKNVHDTDDFFKDAYQHFEEEPSAAAWEKINAGLDKINAESRRKKIFLLRWSAIFLLLLTGGFILYDTMVFKPVPERSNSYIVTKKPGNTAPPFNQYDKHNDLVSSDQKEMIIRDKKHITEYTDPVKNLDLAQHTFFNKKDFSNITATIDHPGLTNEKFAFASTAPGVEDQPGNLQKNVGIESKEKISGIHLMGKYTTHSPFEGSAITGNSFLLPVIGNSVLTNKYRKNKTHQNNRSFIPYWQVTAFVSYDHAGYKLDSDLPANISSIEQMEAHEPSFSAGIFATRQLSGHWGLQTGLIYSNTSIGISPQKLYALTDPSGDIAFKYTTSSGYAYIKPGLGMRPALGDSLNTIEGKHNLQLVRVPLMIKYEHEINKIRIAPGVGIEANFLTTAKVETEIEHPINPEIVFINKLDGARLFHLSIVADAELRYQLNKKTSINLRPVFRYAISPITKNNVVETYPYSFGLGVGMTYRF